MVVTPFHNLAEGTELTYGGKKVVIRSWQEIWEEEQGNKNNEEGKNYHSRSQRILRSELRLDLEHSFPL